MSNSDHDMASLCEGLSYVLPDLKAQLGAVFRIAAYVSNEYEMHSLSPIVRNSLANWLLAVTPALEDLTVILNRNSAGLLHTLEGEAIRCPEF